MPKLWPHQIKALRTLWALLESGERRICLTSPTGGGKTVMLKELIAELVHQGKKVALYTNRVMLTEQTSTVLDGFGVSHGVRASGFEHHLGEQAQVCSLMTEYARCIKTHRWDLHKADVVFVDEAHTQKRRIGTYILNKHIEQGAAIVGVTATPLGIGHLYNKLVVAGTNTELRKCGAHIPCITYGPDEPNLEHVRRTKTGEFVVGDVVKAIHRQSLYGRVEKWWRRLNPDAKPTILFAPGVSESKWFVEQFEANGIRAAHIDGKMIYINGHEYPSTPAMRAEVMLASKQGEIQVLCNRFVLREAVDAPWLYHCIMATPFGSTLSFLQAGGRLLRSCKGMDHVILQDHGGNWHRHGSLNDDRTWDLSLDECSYSASRAKQRVEEKVKDPICCPNCGGLRVTGYKCPFCGHECSFRYKNVIQVDGSLVRMSADHHKRAKKKRETSADQKLWTSTFYSMLNISKRKKLGGKPSTMRQVAAVFSTKTGHLPGPEILGAPKGNREWNMTIEEYQKAMKVQ